MQTAEAQDALKVLVVEDDCLVAADIAAMIEEDAGDRVVCQAVNAREALDCAREVALDAAFVDLNLEDGPTGPEVGRALAREFGVAVIYATGNPELLEPDAPGIAAAVKPITPRCVREALAMIRAHREGRPLPRFDQCVLVLPPFDGRLH